MDTNITQHMIDEDAAVSVARLPGEPLSPPVADTASHEPSPLEAGERLPQSETVRPRRSGRSLLLGGAAVLLVSGAAVAFLVSPYNHVLPVPGLTAEVRQLAAAAGIGQPRKLVAPSATLAQVPLAPPAPPPIRDAYTPKPREDQVRELLALHPNDPKQGLQSNAGRTSSRATPVAPVPVPSPVPSLVQPSSGADRLSKLVVGEPGSQTIPSPGVPDAASPPATTMSVSAGAPLESPAPTAPALPAAATPSLVGEVAPPVLLPAPPPPQAPTRGDAVSVAQGLRAAPMTSQDQMQVLDLGIHPASSAWPI